jgi:hypothetical protein
MHVAGWACVAAALTLQGQDTGADKGQWRAASNTAKSITGDIALAGSKVYINFAAFPAAEIRPLSPAEGAALFDGATGSGSLYKLAIRGDRAFLHKNTLCSGQVTEWMATFASGKQLQVAFFSSQIAPKLNAEALANSTDLCGTFTYVR